MLVLGPNRMALPLSVVCIDHHVVVLALGGAKRAGQSLTSDTADVTKRTTPRSAAGHIVFGIGVYKCAETQYREIGSRTKER